MDMNPAMVFVVVGIVKCLVLYVIYCYVVCPFVDFIFDHGVVCFIGLIIFDPLDIFSICFSTYTCIVTSNFKL